MTPEQKRIESGALYDNIVDYWYEVDNHGGHGTSACFTEDGIFHAGNTPIQGHQAIEEFLLRRVSRGPRTSRHIAANRRGTASFRRVQGASRGVFAGSAGFVLLEIRRWRARGRMATAETL